MSQVLLLPDLPAAVVPPPPPATMPAVARIRRPVRNQVEWMERDLDSLVPEDHPARAIWALLERLDLSAFCAGIKAVIDRPGRPASDPQVLLALWVYGTTQGVGSARQLARLCGEHDVYRWLRGGVPVDYHLLSDFRVGHQEALDQLLTEIVATLMAEDLVSLERVSQDGMRVRASAGAASFRREARLGECLRLAQEQVAALKAQRERPDPALNQHQRAARERAARERLERVERALEQLPAVQAVKEEQKKRAGKERAGKVKEPRVSTTDPQARVMKMADGGFRPAYNVQFATDVDSLVVVGVGAINSGSDMGQAVPMVEQVERRTGEVPGSHLSDGGFVSLEDIVLLTRRGVTVYMPVPEPRQEGRDPFTPLPGDAPEVAAWRQRMGTEEAKALYRQRAASAELTNAQARNRYGLYQFGVRGLDKVLTVATLLAVTHDLVRWIALAS